MNAHTTPPPGAEFFGAALIADAELRDAVLGDLSEEHARLAQLRSRHAANAWYWSQLLRSAVPFSAMAVARGGCRGWMRLAIAVVVSYALLVLLVVRMDSWLFSVLGSPGGTITWQMPVASLASGIICGMIAGYVAALVGRRSPFASALALGALCASLTIAILLRGGDGSPLWYQFGLLAVILPSTAAGALVRARISRRRSSGFAR